MAVITISREVGSDGTLIGRDLADTLGYHFVDKAIIEGILKEYGFAEFERVYETSPSFWDRFDQTTSLTVDMLHRVQRALARHGDVVLIGRGGFACLGGHSDVVNVRIQAPFPIRARRIMELQGFTDLAEAESSIRHADKVRSAFVETHHDVRWDEAGAFDVVFDTSRVPPDLVVATLVQVVERLDPAAAIGPTVAEDFEPDPVLYEYVEQVLAKGFAAE